MNTEEKFHYLNAMQRAWARCEGCMLSTTRKNVVFGYGNIDAQIMIIGEAPGANEDERGVPFVGRAGELLDQYLVEASVRPELTEMLGSGVFDAVRARQLLLQDVYYTNVVSCRPPDNRDPTPAEMEACRSRLVAIIYAIDPVIIITVGAIPLSALMSKKMAVTSARGDIFEVDIPGKIGPYKVPVLSMLHTSYLLRKPDFKQPGGLGEETFYDVLKAHRIVDEYNWQQYGSPKPTNRPPWLSKGARRKK